MRWPCLILVAAALLASTLPTAAQGRACTPAEAERADMDADKPRTWDGLYQSFKRYGHCDDGAIAEGYSESVARILVDHWSELPKLASLSHSDPKFLQFVLRHVDATLNLSDLKKIKTNAVSHCPQDLHATCADLAKHAESAIKESNLAH